MTVELRPLSRRMLRALYRWEMVPAFPASERRPLPNLLRMCRRGDYDALAAFRGEELVGLALMWRGHAFVLLDYLLVCRGKQNGGVGQAIVAALRERYAAFRAILAEVEAPLPGGSEREEQLRRLSFYRRCGFASLGYRVSFIPCWGCGTTFRSRMRPWMPTGRCTALSCRRRCSGGLSIFPMKRREHNDTKVCVWDAV